jgi:hypothetical protein
MARFQKEEDSVASSEVLILDKSKQNMPCSAGFFNI